MTTSGDLVVSDSKNLADFPKELGAADLIGFVEMLVRSGRHDAALDAYQEWLLRNPSDPIRHAIYFNYGSLLSETGQPAHAAAAFANAIAIAPTFLPAYINAGLAAERLGRNQEAINCWLQVINTILPLDGDYIGYTTMALKHLARVFKAVGDCSRAEEALRRNIEVDQHQRDVIQHWIAMREVQCKWPVIAPFGKLTLSSLMAALSPLALAIHTNDPVYQLANAWRTYDQERIQPSSPHTAGRWIPPCPAGRPRALRIGYVSPDLREHAIGFLTAELFELHDRTRTEIFAYFSGPGEPDPLQRRIRQTVDHWRHITGWTAKQSARQIVTDEIDILVDLGGHTNGAPGGAFALRPAPIIVNWLGYPGSMGTPHHQYIIADETIIPSSHEKFYSERVLRLPCYQPTDRKRISGNPPSRIEVQLPESDIIFCCFNGPQKITPVMFRCWMEILARVPESTLWLLSCDAATDDRLRHQATWHGVSPLRLVFATRKPNAEHLARYCLCDLFLDTSPYGAHTTASDALWMGVPVLTLAGHSFASRVCASLVRASGLPELVCDSLETYTDHAVAIATWPDRLRALQHKLRARRNNCTLFDTPLLVTRLEGLYEQIWQEYLSGQIPEPDLLNLALYAEVGAELAGTTDDSPDLLAYEQRYRTAISYRHSVSPVPADARLWLG